MTWFRSPDIRRVAALIAFAGLLVQAGFAAWHIVRMGQAGGGRDGAPRAMLACGTHGPATAWNGTLGAGGGGKSAPKPACPCRLGLTAHLALAPLPALAPLTGAPRAPWPVPATAAAALSGRSLLAPEGRGPPLSA